MNVGFAHPDHLTEIYDLATSRKIPPFLDTIQEDRVKIIIVRLLHSEDVTALTDQTGLIPDLTLVTWPIVNSQLGRIGNHLGSIQQFKIMRREIPQTQLAVKRGDSFSATDSSPSV